MKKTKQAFSLIEIITATVILTIAVFGVFKMINENNKIINNHEIYNTATSLFQPFKECLKKLNPDISEKNYLSLNNCQKSDSQTGIILNNIDYILSYSGTTKNTFDLYIKTDSLKIKQEFVVK